MEGCILCLDNIELEDSIKVGSTQWQELQVKTLIDKHLWTMESLPPSWLCCECWRTLLDFHKFYMRIEEAHMDFGLLVKTKIEAILKDEKEVIPNDDESNDFFECHFEPDISVDPLVMEDHKLIIKEDPDEDNCKDNIPLMQRQTRSQNSKPMTINTGKTNKTALKKFKKLNTSKCNISKRRRKSNPSQKSVSENSAVKSQIQLNLENSSNCDDSYKDSECCLKKSLNKQAQKQQQDPFSLQIADKCDLPQSYPDCDDVNTASDYKPEVEKNLSSSDCVESSTDSDYKPDEEDCNTDSDYKPEGDCNRQTSKQIDQFLAENFKLTCVFCKIPMATFKAVLNHWEQEHEERGYVVCCDKKFYQRVVLVEHVHHHVDPSKFKCFECGKEMSSRRALKSHQIIHLSEEQKKFACSKCGKHFAAQSILTYHMKAVHLKRYLKICDICGISLRNDSFKRHMLEHEGKPIPQLNCDICGLLLSNKRNLKRHISMQHPVGGGQTHNCHLCPKISPNIRALNEHIYRVHIVGKIHKCTMCGRGFKRKLALKEHIATHTGIALYTCPWCPKTFNANSSMHAHRKRQHRVEWELAQKQKKIEKYITPHAPEINNTDVP